MKYHLFFAFLLLFSFNQETFAQQNTINNLISEGKYEQAIELLNKGETEKMQNDQLQNLGYCYVMANNFIEAEKIYYELTTREKSDSKNIQFYAETQLVNKKYDQAKENFEKYLELNPTNNYTINKIKSCDSLKKWDSEVPQYEIENLPNINTTSDETSSFIMNGKFYFLTNEQIKDIDSSQTNIYKQWLTNIFLCSSYTYCKYNNLLAYSLRYIDNNNGSLGNSIIMFDKPQNTDFKNLILFKWEGMPKNINIAHPNFANKGKRLYFSSDMPSGYGGMDIYYSDFKNGAWSIPTNLGENINTEFDELSPSCFGDTLYFSSKGHTGYGYFDIFYCLVNDNNFSNPVNLKSPINSIANDLFFYKFSKDEAFLSSDRAETSKGEFDIYKVTPISEIVEDTVITVAETYKFDVKSYKLPYLLFDNNSYEIWESNESVLKNLADTLKKYDYLSLEILGFTDTIGNDFLNQELSTNRAQSVAETLLGYGVSNSQISFEGQGKSRKKTNEGIRFHVFIGTTASNNEIDWYSELLKNKYQILVMPYGKLFSYYLGDFNNKKDAIQFSEKLKKEFSIDFFVGTSYNGECIPNYLLAINRRVEIKIIEK